MRPCLKKRGWDRVGGWGHEYEYKDRLGFEAITSDACKVMKKRLSKLYDRRRPPHDLG